MRKLVLLTIILMAGFFANAQSPEFFVNAKSSDGKTSGDCQNGFGTCAWGTGVYTVTYTGNFLNGKPNGIGKYYRMIEKFPLAYRYESYEGNWKDGFYDGLGTYKMEKLYKKKESQDSNELLTYKGNWKNGLKEGAGKYFEKSLYLEYKKYDGNWKNNEYDGYGSFSEKWRNDIEKSYVGNWKDGRKDGQGISNEGNVYEGLWRQNQHIKGKIYDYKGVLLFEGDEKGLEDFRQGKRDLEAENERIAEKHRNEIEEYNKKIWEQNRVDTKTPNNTNVVQDAQSERTAKCMCCLGTGQKEIKGMYLGTKTYSVTPVNGLGISHDETVSVYGPSTFVQCSCCH